MPNHSSRGRVNLAPPKFAKEIRMIKIAVVQNDPPAPPPKTFPLLSLPPRVEETLNSKSLPHLGWRRRWGRCQSRQNIN